MPSPSRGPAPRRGPLPRRTVLAALALVVVAGLALQVVRSHVPGSDVLGGALYTVAVAGVVALLVPRRPAWAIAACALVVSVTIELAQLTPYPARAGAAFAPARLVLGSSFAATDLVACAVGAGVALALLALTPRAEAPGTPGGDVGTVR